MRPAHETDALGRRLASLFGPAGFRPPVDVYVDGEAVHVRMEIAGLDPDSAAVSLEGRVLRIAGERLPGHGRRVSYQHMEIAYGPFERRVELPADVDPQRAHATYAGGLLTVSLPVAPQPRAPRVVVVRVAR